MVVMVVMVVVVELTTALQNPKVQEIKRTTRRSINYRHLSRSPCLLVYLPSCLGFPQPSSPPTSALHRFLAFDDLVPSPSAAGDALRFRLFQ